MLTWALADGNCFYCSAHRVLEPELRKRPLCVLSNNDGAVVSRTNEAKALGIKMSQPAHELKDLVKKHGLILRSANFSLYGNFHERMMQVIRASVPRAVVDSVDEVFLDLTGVRDRVAFAHTLRDRVYRWVGIPVSIGIGGPTLTLAKMGNKMAKKGEGVVDISDPDVRAARMQNYPVEDVWGVGPRWTIKLRALGITTAAQLRDAPTDLILERFGIVLLRTQRELQGSPCQQLCDIEPDRQQIVVSRSFGNRVEDHTEVMQAIASFTVTACANARRRGLVAGGIWITANTDAFRPELPQHHPSRAITLPSPTSDSMQVLHAIRALTKGFLRRGFAYKRAGIALIDLARPTNLQTDLFEPPTVGNDALMSVMDTINRRFGRGTLGPAATGWRDRPAWRMRQNSLSPNYTTRVQDLPVARC